MSLPYESATSGDKALIELQRILAKFGCQSYKPIAPQGLQEAFTETRRELADLRTEIISGREWQNEFRSSLQEHSAQIKNLLEILKEEKDNRVASQRDFDDRLRELQKEVYKQATRLGAIIGGIVIIAGLIVQYIFPKIFPP